MTTITEHRKQNATSLAFDMLRGEDFHGMTAKQVAFLRGVIGRAYPDIRGEGGSDHPSWQTIRWYDGTSEWALSWWSRSGGGGQLVNHTLSSARDSLRRTTELRATRLELLQNFLRGTDAFVVELHKNGGQLVKIVAHYSEAYRREPSLRRQIQWHESRIAAVEAQRESVGK